MSRIAVFAIVVLACSSCSVYDVAALSADAAMDVMLKPCPRCCLALGNSCTEF